MSYAMPAISAGLFLASSIAHVYARHVGKNKLAFFTKPLLMPLLLATFLTAVSSIGETVPRIQMLVIALTLYTAGDIFLALPDEKRPALFLIGMAAFMAGHICYATWFLTFSGWNTLAWQAMAIVSIVVMALLVIFCRKVLSSKTRQAPWLCAYGVLMGVFSVCVASSWGTGPIAGTIVALAGTASYTLSDSFIAMDKVSFHVAGDDIIMTTYLLANILLLAGVWILTRTPTVYVLL
ncbi:MAG: lysoplasmalogenase [Sphaerochaetaceae bacterium]|nr:lysoplasmalogenase [Sphaerochaetaceae bacterium]